MSKGLSFILVVFLLAVALVNMNRGVPSGSEIGARAALPCWLPSSRLLSGLRLVIVASALSPRREAPHLTANKSHGLRTAALTNGKSGGRALEKALADAEVGLHWKWAEELRTDKGGVDTAALSWHPL